jgi:hypothetical protein
MHVADAPKTSAFNLFDDLDSESTKHLSDILTRQQNRILYVSLYSSGLYNQIKNQQTIDNSLTFEDKIVACGKAIVSLLTTKDENIRTFMFSYSDSVEDYILTDVKNNEFINSLTNYWKTNIPINGILFSEYSRFELASARNSTGDFINNIREISFEATNSDIVNALYADNKNHEKIIHKTDKIFDQSECAVCMNEKSKYYCEKCNSGVCSQCYDKLMHSTGMCPSCRCIPFIVLESK